MHPGRNILVLAIVALALCADGMPTPCTGASQPRTPHDTLAGQLVRKLQVSLRRVVPQPQAAAVVVFKPTPVIVQRATRVEAPEELRRLPLSPFQFRLPPPIPA